MQWLHPHQRSPHAVKSENRSQEETERQERCARVDAWRLAKDILMLKETDKATFFSHTNECRFRREHGHGEQERPEV